MSLLASFSARAHTTTTDDSTGQTTTFSWKSLPDDVRLLVFSKLNLNDAFNLNIAYPHQSHSCHIRKRITHLKVLRDAWIHSEQSPLPSYANPPHLSTSSARSNLKPLEFVLLTTLTLRRSHLNTLPAIEELERLRVVDVSYNNLTFLPIGLSACIHLRVLNLGHNQLDHFPQVVMNLPNLCTLLLHHNPITTLPMERWSELVYLYRLGLFQCKLSGTLPEKLCQLLTTPTVHGRHRSANIQHNEFRREDVSVLFDRFPRLSNSILT